MKWETVQHLDLRRVGRSAKPFQPHAAAFHPTQAIVAAAAGTYITEFDAYTGTKIASMDIGSPVVRMAYSPTGGNCIIAVLEDCTIRSCDFDTEQTCVLHSPEKKRVEQISVDTEVHLAMTPLQPILFFGFHRRMSVTVVGTVIGGKAPTKIKTDLKKPVVNLACHPRLPVLYVTYADGLVRGYNIHTYTVSYTLQIDNTVKLIGAGAFAFHPTLEWIFIGDRCGKLLAWDVSTERPMMIGITQVGSQPISSVGWLPMLGLLVTLSKDGSIQVWKTLNQNRPPNFFETAASESIDIPHILSQRGGEAVHALPQVKALEIHPRLNLAAIVFASMDWKNRAAYTRQGRKQLFAVLQSARGSSASVLKEKLTSLGSSVILADHQLQAQLQEHHSKGQNHITISDIARKAFLYSHFMEGHFKFVPITRLPLITILDNKHLLRYLPVCQPFHLELNFFSKENRVLEYPVRAFYLEGPNLMAYNLASGVDNVYKKLYTSVPATVELHPKNIAFSQKKHLFLAIYELSGATHEVTLYWENTDPCSANSKATTIKGRAAAFIGPNDNHFVILDEDKTGLRLYTLPEESSMDKNMVDVDKADVSTIKGPVHFMLESEVDCIFNTPQESTLIFVSHGDQIGLAKLNADGSYISTKGEGKRSIKLKANEMVLQVHWQATLRGFVAGILTTQTVLIVSADLDVLACSCTKFDKGLPSFRSLLWVGPALLFSTTTSINMLGWDGKVRTILCICMPNAVLVGALNDRLLLANPTNINPRQKKRIEIKSCLVGFLEPLLIGFATMQQRFEQKLELSEVLYQITSRFDSLRITPRSLDILASGSPVCGDLAVSLSQSGPQFTQGLRGSYAIKALGFSTALSILKDEFLRSRDYPRCPPTSHLFHRFRQLGRACIRYGQFDCAKETFEVISDYESMLDLFICHLNPSAMRRLAQTLEEGGGNSELRRYCERILRVGCTGWSTFGNFAAESMAPKQPEWGGGNWEIKTRTNIKDVPQWPLAAEVIPYMRNDNGTIPTIVPDHIGVYMGIIKGRGNVIEVREDRLVKADIGASGLHEMSQSSGSHAVDEQTKVAEEFKKSILYGSAADDSSSDEEEGSKTKRLQIKIKPVASTSVDVDKIKQATKQLNLDLPLGRTNKSLAGDHGLISSQTPATIASRTVPVVSAPSGLVQPTPFSQSCLGVAAGPIPEDFFQNTISPYQVVKSLPPSGNYLSRLDQSSQGNEVNKVIPNQGSAAVADSISSGAVPVQATQQPPVFGESIGVLQPARLVQSQITQVPVSTKPLDLSSSGKVPASPKAVRPGHVPRGAPASVCFETGLAHLEQNQLPDALSCFDEAFLALAKDQSRGVDIKARATINGQYKIAVTLLQEINRLQKVGGSSAKDEMARLSRHLGSLPLRSNHRRNCIRTAIKRNMDVQNYAYSKQMLELLLPETPAGKQGELRSLIDVICERGVSNKTIDDALEDPSQFCAATLGRLSTIGYDVCDQCKAKFSALSTPGCIICGMGSIRRSDALPLPSPFLADIYSN